MPNKNSRDKMDGNSSWHGVRLFHPMFWLDTSEYPHTYYVFINNKGIPHLKMRYTECTYVLGKE